MLCVWLLLEFNDAIYCVNVVSMIEFYQLHLLLSAKSDWGCGVVPSMCRFDLLVVNYMCLTTLLHMLSIQL